MKDSLLIEGIKNDDNKAFKMFFDRYYKPLVGYIKTFTNDFSSAEDIAQQTFITIWTKRHKLASIKSPKSYLYSIGYNTYIDYYRKIKKQDVFFDELREKALRNSIVEDKEILEKRLKKLKIIIDSLPERCKEILELNKLNGLRYKEIAVKLDISKKTVESQMRIAFQKIRKGFESDQLFLFFLKNIFNIEKGAQFKN